MTALAIHTSSLREAGAWNLFLSMQRSCLCNADCKYNVESVLESCDSLPCLNVKRLTLACVLQLSKLAQTCHTPVRHSPLTVISAKKQHDYVRECVTMNPCTIPRKTYCHFGRATAQLACSLMDCPTPCGTSN
jgi:hypothetical protein